MTLGRLVSWDASRGFGFLRIGDGSRDAFLHWRVIDAGLEDTPVADGDLFEAIIEEAEKGPRCTYARRLDPTAQPEVRR